MIPPANAVVISNFLSLAAIKIFPSRRDSNGKIVRGGHASGFLWELGQELFLITNWHNVCAWDPVNDTALSKKAFTPNCVELIVELAHDVGDGRIRRDARQAVIDLFDSSGRPTWLEHPTFGHRVDVVAMKIGVIDAKLNNRPINTYSEFVDFDVMVGDDVFVLGFPLGLDGGPRLPIWKRASVATEPHYDLDQLPRILIDTATRQGMSGAPAIVVRRGFTIPRGKEARDGIFGVTETFLGVYSGRVGDDALGAQLGVVWKAAAVDEIVRNGVAGRTPFD